MKVIIVEPGKRPYTKDIPHTLDSMQETVGGYIQAVYPWEDPVALICDEEAKLTGKELNRALYDEDGHMYDIVAGTFFICGLGSDNFEAIPDNLIEKYTELFKYPESFVRVVGGKILVIKDETIMTVG